MDDTSRYTAREVKEMLERKDAQLQVRTLSRTVSLPDFL